MIRFQLIILALLISVCTAFAGTILLMGMGLSGSGLAIPIWNELLIGAGGQLTNLQITPDGTKAIRTDTYGGYIWNGSRWRQVVTSTSMPVSQVVVDNNDGAYELSCAPSNSSICYMMYTGNVFVSINKGVTWSSTTFTTVSASANVSTKNFGPYIAIDPANPSIAYVGTPSAGLFKTLDQGLNWSLVAGVAVGTTSPGSLPQGGGNLIIFDPTSAVVGGVTQGIYVTSYGTGVYHSINGSTFSLTTGSPNNAGHLAMGQDGVLYLVANEATNNLYIYNGSWSTHSVGSNGNPLSAAAVDPVNANRIVVINNAGLFSTSLDHGSTWTNFASGAPVSWVSSDIPWLAWVQSAICCNQFMATPTLVFDPTGANLVYAPSGIAVWYTNPPNVLTTPYVWTSQTLGIEQLVANNVISVPGGPAVTLSWDRPTFYTSTLQAFPATYGPNNVNGIVMGWDADYQSTNPAHLVGLFNYFGVPESSFSNDGGQTWTNFPTLPHPETIGLISGGIAIDSGGNIAIFPMMNSDPYLSQDNGSTWNAVIISGVPVSPAETGWGTSFFLYRHIVTSDKVAATTLYAFNYLTSSIYRSVDGGSNWTLRATTSCFGTGTGQLAFNFTLKASPYVSGELLGTAGPQSGTHPVATGFCHSTDGGATWTALANVAEVRMFGWGIAKPGSGATSSVYINGWVNNVFGIWESNDGLVSWHQLDVWPENSIDTITAMNGDLNSYGRLYVGFRGSGWTYGILKGSVLKPIVSTESVSAIFSTSATINWITDLSSNSVVNYGTTSSYGSSVSNASIVTSHSVNITGLSNYTLYHYQAQSTSGILTGSSYDLTFRTANIIPPTVPTGLSATAAGPNRVNLSWTASTDVQGVAGYNIYRNSVFLFASPGTSTSTSDLGAFSSTTYSYTVSAFDASGNVSAQSSPASATTSAPATYVGAGDINGSALTFYSTRCISSSYVGPIIDVWDAATGNTTKTQLYCDHGGILQTVNNLSVTCAIACNVGTWYDQSAANNCSANPCDVLQPLTTGSRRFTFTTNCMNGYGCVVGNQFNASMLTANSFPTISGAAFSISFVAKTLGTGGTEEIFGGFVMNVGFGSTANNIYLYGGGSNQLNATAADNSFHAAQLLSNNPSSASSIYIDGSLTVPGNDPGNGWAAGILSVGSNQSGGGNICNCTFEEIGAWSGNKSANNASINSNQHGATYGFNF